MTDETKYAQIFGDLARLKLTTGGGDGDDDGVAREVLTHVPLVKPHPQEFFRGNSDPTMSLVTSIVFDMENFGRDAYLVVPEMRTALLGDVRPVLLMPVITRQAVVKIWPLKLPIEGNRSSPWHDTAREAIERSKTRWICVKPDVSLGAYRILEAIGDIPDPVWPNKGLNELLEIAFRGRVIDTEDHPIVRRLRGAA